MQLRARIRERPCRRSRLYLLLRTHTAVRRPPGNPAAETTRPCICAHCECDVILNYVRYVIIVVFIPSQNDPSQNDMSSKLLSQSQVIDDMGSVKNRVDITRTRHNISCVTFLTLSRPTLVTSVQANAIRAIQHTRQSPGSLPGLKPFS